MVNSFRDEAWKELILPDKVPWRFMLSNYGRIVRFKDDFHDGVFVKTGVIDGYHALVYRANIDNKIKGRTRYIHKLVAEYFVPGRTDGQKFVIHLDQDKGNNYYKNLAWANHKEVVEHNKTNPAVVKALKDLIENNRKRDGVKLTETKVKLIKKKLADPNRKTRLKMIAQQFGISEMQLYRIKSGENWGHVTID